MISERTRKCSILASAKKVKWMWKVGCTHNVPTPLLFKMFYNLKRYKKHTKIKYTQSLLFQQILHFALRARNFECTTAHLLPVIVSVLDSVPKHSSHRWSAKLCFLFQFELVCDYSLYPTLALSALNIGGIIEFLFLD